MTAQFARAPQRGRPAGGTPIHEPHAALLIDFDNVTMGIRSDLTKELKNLLNSDIIKGKVAVQRAYADWRRYPQYIVPLAESSVDLIFAPAYGSAKKNATDIRLAIDAVELVFTRPEIGTIILLSGDSDFSSLVLKLKEYGKYVIGVGIRESASDLLVQNCDEYYSYSALTGLTRAGEEQPVVSEDPWELVALAVGQMVDNNDVMRSDRLKQVLLELDPAFDEKALGFQKFNKFLQEAATRGLLVLRKQENGQYDVGAGDGEPVPAAADSEQRESRRSRGRRGRGGRRDEPRRDLADDQPAVELRPESVATGEEAEEPPSPAPVADAASSKTAPPPRAEHEVEMEPVAAAVPAAAAPAAAAPAEPVPPREAAEASEPSPAREKSASRAAARGNAPAATTDLKAAYSLLRRAATDLVRKSGGSARDSDVKRRMLELEPGWDEAPLGFSKFSRFLRQAHDAEVVTLRKGESGNYDVVPGNAEVPAGEDERGGRRDRERSTRGRTPTEEQTAAAARDAAPGTRQEERPTRTAAAKEAPVASAAAAVAGAAPTPSSAIGFRRGSRGRSAPSGPPPLLDGQAAAVSKPPTRTAHEPAQEAQPAAAETSSARKIRPAARRGAAAPVRAAAKSNHSPARSNAKAPARTTARKAAPAKARFDAASLGLPTDAGEIASYMTSYPGVGPKSVQALIDTFGAAKVFDALETQADRVRDVITGARGDRLLEAWADDVAARRAGQTPRPAAAAAAVKAARPEPAPDEAQPADSAERKSRSRRSGRRGGRGRQSPAK